MLNTIDIHKLLPLPLREQQISGSEIWTETLRFQKGKSYKINAGSGKGKSTLTHILYGLRQDYEGQVHFDGKNIQTLNNNEWADYRQQHISIIFQDLRLFQELSPEENIAVKNALQKSQSLHPLEEMYDILGLAKLRHKACKYLSYGERQRIAIIRALQQPFDFLLLDEPFSHLDRDNIAKAAQLILQESSHRKAGIIFTSLGDDYELSFDHKINL